MVKDKKTPWYTKMRNVVIAATAVIVLLGSLGYSVSASMPPSRTEMMNQFELAKTEVTTGLQELRVLIGEAKEMTLVLTGAVQINTDDRMFQRYKFLRYKQEDEGLTIEEQRELCHLAAVLDMPGPGCS
jgi:hypothetical protein